MRRKERSLRLCWRAGRAGLEPGGAPTAQSGLDCLPTRLRMFLTCTCEKGSLQAKPAAQSGNNHTVSDRHVRQSHGQLGHPPASFPASPAGLACSRPAPRWPGRPAHDPPLGPLLELLLLLLTELCRLARTAAAAAAACRGAKPRRPSRLLRLKLLLGDGHLHRVRSKVLRRKFRQRHLHAEVLVPRECLAAWLAQRATGQGVGPWSDSNVSSLGAALRSLAGQTARHASSSSSPPARPGRGGSMPRWAHRAGVVQGDASRGPGLQQLGGEACAQRRNESQQGG